MFKSELLKLKNSIALYLIFIFTILEICTIPIYLHYINVEISMTNLSIVTMLIYPILIVILTIMSFEQEMSANNFQEIKANKKGKNILLVKFFVIDCLLFFPTAFIWLATGLIQNDIYTSLVIASASWLLSIFQNHIHGMMNFIIGKGENILLSIIEILFIIFASNKALIGSYWCPVALPINLILTGNITYVIITVFWIILCTIILYALLSKKKK
ncbi:transporter [Streptococcus sp. H49]|uniref:transporter n=1 Tax=Streptococcus huangxiaojuni TaxID=3237239 RepID=UPI0034A4CE5A